MRMWQLIRATSLERHVHAEAYAALVLSGSYEEAGDNGRFAVSAGDVVFHDRFEAHLDRFSKQGAMVLNLQLGSCHHVAPGIASVADPDFIARLAKKNHKEAVDFLLSVAKIWVPCASDWPDELATQLIQNPSLKLSEWGAHRRLATWNISRGFARVFGISPEAFRTRVRARLALRSIEDSQTPLARIAADLGFADQAHMTRSVRRLTGTTPGSWRSTANGFKTQRQSAV